MNFIIRKAERKKAKLRLGLLGVSGSGKTIGAINIALGMKKKFIIIDTENRSADLYSDVGEYDVLELQRPFSPERYVEAIKQCELLGYELIIIDSLSHAWFADGGILDIQHLKTEASKNKNSYAAWRDVTPLHNNLIHTILQSSCDIIVTMRCKTHYNISEDNGKMRINKMGLDPIQRDGLDYEFTTVLEIDRDSHLYTASKDRTKIFEGKTGKITQDTGKDILNWLNDGRSVEEVENIEIENIKSSMLLATFEELKNQYLNAKELYPHRKDELFQIVTERKAHLLNGGAH